MIIEDEIIFIGNGYLEEEQFSSIPSYKPEKNYSLYICENQDQVIAKTNISTCCYKNFSISLDDIERLDENHIFHNVFFVGETLSTIDMSTFEELKDKCLNIYEIPNELFNTKDVQKINSIISSK